VKLDDRGRPIQEEDDLDLGDNCIIVPPALPGQAEGDTAAPPVAREETTGGRRRTSGKARKPRRSRR
jgi:hypothetical protein